VGKGAAFVADTVKSLPSKKGWEMGSVGGEAGSFRYANQPSPGDDCYPRILVLQEVRNKQPDFISFLGIKYSRSLYAGYRYSILCNLGLLYMYIIDKSNNCLQTKHTKIANEWTSKLVLLLVLFQWKICTYFKCERVTSLSSSSKLIM
jgi:hypothetical protein